MSNKPKKGDVLSWYGRGPITLIEDPSHDLFFFFDGHTRAKAISDRWRGEDYVYFANNEVANGWTYVEDEFDRWVKEVRKEHEISAKTR